jgi:multidrug efflux pump subunit AcrA (membrane-fusion protein)
MKTIYFRAWVFWFVLTLLLSSCGNSSPKNEPETLTNTWVKTPFIVEVIKIGTSSWKSEIEKSARIIASSSLTLSTQSAGEISKILVREWQSVKAWSTLINIKDSLTNLDLRLDQAENTVEMQTASIETSKANLEISVENARIWYERAKQAYDNLTSKNGLQYETLVNNNSKTLDAYNGSYATYLADLDRSMTQMLYEGDKILGISPEFDSASDSWDSYLGARIGDSRVLAINAWNKAYASRGLIRAKIEKWAKFDVNTIVADLGLATDSFETLRKYADAMVYMIQNNVVWGWLPDALQNGWILSWNWFRAQIQWSEGGFNAWKSQVSTFLKSYNDSETAVKLAVESLTRVLTANELAILNSNSNLKITYENARLDLDDRFKTTKLSLEQAEIGYKNAKILRDATIRQLLAGKRSAEIALEQAKRDYSKLRVTAPVDWTITRIIASLWQTVWVWTPTLEISGKVPEILLDIDDSLAKTLEVGMEVWVIVDEKTLAGTITAVSQVSSSNLLSSLRIWVPTGWKYIGKSVIVKITPGESETTINDNILPLDAVHIISEVEWEINILTQTGEIIKKLVKIGSVEGENIKILSEIQDNTKIIVSDMTNYDPLKNTISIQ